MTKNAYIKLVPSSAKKDITLDEVKELLLYYKNLTSCPQTPSMSDCLPVAMTWQVNISHPQCHWQL
ncbi:hypothetical protein PB1_01900 [Bacillus methanolicus PB1]|uniref:Uncharacterized protein n=1 Tax=Bacillus methanolicus PB1 TaxID=997296 RepID=I3E584_BACMT|nr:DUF1885 family protein [Bacillus methanolicus]EIJ81655.1 hypothetical protein PB1_01900 [Bacillus methanolicus PB1]